jgi:hypothetical protein
MQQDQKQHFTQLVSRVCNHVLVLHRCYLVLTAIRQGLGELCFSITYLVRHIDVCVAGVYCTARRAIKPEGRQLQHVQIKDQAYGLIAVAWQLDHKAHASGSWLFKLGSDWHPHVHLSEYVVPLQLMHKSVLSWIGGDISVLHMETTTPTWMYWPRLHAVQ